MAFPSGGVIYAKQFFDRQLLFAHKVTVLSGLPLARALLEYTNLYRRFGLGRDFDPACFPLPALSVQASVREFYDFYGT